MSREFSSLSFEKARLSVRLGHTEEERKEPQEVDLQLNIRFAEPPPACVTDNLVETVCYDEMIAASRSYIEGKEFKLIEKLSCDLYKLMKGMLPASASFCVRITKLSPPVRELYGGVSFSFGDFHPE